MPETLLSASRIKLYGRVLTDLQIDQSAGSPPEATHPNELGQNQFLRRQMVDTSGSPPTSQAVLARIYAFSYGGHFYELSVPSIFLVHGSGEDVTPTVPVQKGKGKPGDLAGEGAVAPGTVDETGVPAKGWDFMEDIRMWQYDKGDFSMRLDVDSGQFEQILLEATIQPESYFGGARVSGARVSGARVSGARVSGARVSGARVGGNSD
jgi:hypothetical protein